MKSKEQLIRDCSYEIIVGMEDNIPKEELFSSLFKKYDDDILMKALEMVDQFQHWRAKKHGIDLSKYDREFTRRGRNMGCFEPEMNFFSGNMVREKGNDYGK